ncbi:MAG: DUF423 domain-containing protein [Myxococcota bacterium]
MRFFLAIAAAHGFLAVALGAFGAHGLGPRLEGLADGATRLAWWTTAAHYQLTHALALALVSVLRAAPWTDRMPAPLLRASAVAFAVGPVIFSGTLYVMTLTGLRALGAVTPLGGLCLLAGWALLFVAALRARAA